MCGGDASTYAPSWCCSVSEPLRLTLEEARSRLLSGSHERVGFGRREVLRVAGRQRPRLEKSRTTRSSSERIQGDGPALCDVQFPVTPILTRPPDPGFTDKERRTDPHQPVIAAPPATAPYGVANASGISAGGSAATARTQAEKRPPSWSGPKSWEETPLGRAAEPRRHRDPA
jgi:hypothetical protein